MNYFNTYCENHLKQTENEFNVLFWDYVININKMRNFYNAYNTRQTVLELSKKELLTEQDHYILKNILQNDYRFGSFVYWLEKCDERLNTCKNKVFDILSKTTNPYKFIFNPIWFQNTLDNKYGFYKNETSGVNDITIFVAGEYTKYLCLNN